ncbi:hypothetical protein PG994_002833 [Apiospora phragmitis]|uniref:Uncharacterized protein n=1 Tax=Apiospora phragmitis TaxID=2905665 RepID=A0ABR1W921_9PEZI
MEYSEASTGKDRDRLAAENPALRRGNNTAHPQSGAANLLAARRDPRMEPTYLLVGAQGSGGGVGCVEAHQQDQ